jgi:PAS domain S-box-containing protein
MKNQNKSKRPSNEPAALRRRIRELEKIVDKSSQTEKELRERERRCRLLIESISEGLIMQDKNQIFTFVNNRVCETLGYSKEEMIGRPVFDFFDEKCNRIVKEHLKLRRQGKSSSYELTFRRKDGHEIYVIVSGHALLGPGGEYNGSLAVITDITRHKYAEWELRESEKRLRKLSEATQEGIMFHDRGRIIDANLALARMTGYKTEELIGRDGFMLVAPDYHAVVRENILKGSEEPYEIRGRRKDGTTFPVEIIGRTFSYKGQKLRVASFRDITNRRLTEEKLKKAGERLRLERKALREKKIALKQILNQIEEEKNSIKEYVLANVNQMIIPSIHRLKARCTPSQKKRLDHIERSLKELAFPLINRLKSSCFDLTPRELEICDLIKKGMISKEISEELNVSVLTIHKHREFIRKKLGITNRNINLNSYLQSI